MDVILDLWISAIYKDQQVRGSEIGPVAYFRNGTGNPLVNYSELSARWGISRSSVGRLLKKLADFDYLSLLTFPGRSGTVIYLKNYLSTMFRISDVMIQRMLLNVPLKSFLLLYYNFALIAKKVCQPIRLFFRSSR